MPNVDTNCSSPKTSATLMLPKSLVSMKSSAQHRHHDVEQVPGQEGDRPREREAAVAASQLAELGGGVEAFVHLVLHAWWSVGVGHCELPLRARPGRGLGRRMTDHGRKAVPSAAGVRSLRTAGRAAVGWTVGRVRRTVSRPQPSTIRRTTRPRSSATLSGVCSRTMSSRRAPGRVTASAARPRPSSGTPAAPSTRPAGRAGRPASPVRRRRAGCRGRRRRTSSPPTSMPATAPTSVSRRHQMPSTISGQNVEAAKANASPTARATPTPSVSSASSSGSDTATTAPIWKERTPPSRRPHARPAQHVLAEHAGDRDRQPARGRQERGERAGRGQRGQQRAGDALRPSVRAAPARRCRSARTRRGRGRRSGRGRRTPAGARRRARAGPAPRASYGGRPGRRGWCRSARRRAGGPWCRGTSRR